MMINRQSFTLIELLIVTSILAVVIGAIGACLAGGIRVWDSARTFDALERDAAIGLTVMEKDLVNELPIYAIGFEGRTDVVRVPALLNTDGEPAVGSVAYAFDRQDRALVRRELSDQGVEIRHENLVRNVEDLSMTYASLQKGEGRDDRVTWQAQSDPVTNVPGRIEIALSLSDGERSVELTRTVLLPVR